jgi:hypothetical protein
LHFGAAVAALRRSVVRGIPFGEKAWRSGGLFSPYAVPTSRSQRSTWPVPW